MNQQAKRYHPQQHEDMGNICAKQLQKTGVGPPPSSTRLLGSAYERQSREAWLPIFQWGTFTSIVEWNWSRGQKKEKKRQNTEPI